MNHDDILLPAVIADRNFSKLYPGILRMSHMMSMVCAAPHAPDSGKSGMVQKVVAKTVTSKQPTRPRLFQADSSRTHATVSD
jgi:hypothetical protein